MNKKVFKIEARSFSTEFVIISVVRHKKHGIPVMTYLLTYAELDIRATSGQLS
jgi:hypothetical protein